MQGLTVVRLTVRLTLAALVVAAVGLGVPVPAEAATCTSASGVSVVVDFHQLGGGVQTACDANGAGKYADAQFKDVGHTLTYVQRTPGFVCRVDGSPSSDPCVNTPPSNAYWSVWWSDGKSGTWTYSSSGVGSLKVPEGGYVALSWQQGDGKVKPGVAPTAHSSPSPSPSPSPSHSPTPSPSHSPSRAPSDSPSPRATHPAGPLPATSPKDPGTTSGGSTPPGPDSTSARPAAHGSKSQQSRSHGHAHAQASADAR
ncbi:MAG: hypothetical protein J2P22_10235, partial [Nocardioides sp.]|nr:hypothetical protein [Nocardioides sp.]